VGRNHMLMLSCAPFQCITSIHYHCTVNYNTSFIYTCIYIGLNLPLSQIYFNIQNVFLASTYLVIQKKAAQGIFQDFSYF
jgi:hypothetical protein